MRKKRTIILFWALFSVPTLIIAGFAYTLLSHEQERINSSAVRALSQRAQAVAETIHLTIETVQNNLEQSLFDIDQDRLEDELMLWEQTNPLVRNAFIYRPGKNLEYPSQGPGTFEKRRFLARYESFFSGRVKFDVNQAVETDKAVAAVPSGKIARYTRPAKPVEKKKSSRQKLVDLSRSFKKDQAVLQAASVDSEAGGKYIHKSGWIPWFSENQLFILGWVQEYENSSIYGIEIEWVTLLSRLVVDLPRLDDKNVAMVLMDGNTHIIHQMGQMKLSDNGKPEVVIPVSSLLPHWQIAVFVDNKGFGSGGQGFFILSMILLGTFIVSIVSGGLLLTRMTLMNIKDAHEKTSFVSSVSHELKTPLTSIRMYAELLSSKRVKDENKTQNYLSVIVNESQRLTRLINNVLDFGRLEQGKKTYQHQVVDVCLFLSEMIKAHSIRICEKGLEIRTNIIEPGNENSYLIKTDRDALEQVFLNLLDNALKYAGTGKFIRFVLEHNDSYVEMKICDDGPGIPKAQRDMIFKKFYRADDSLTAKEPGSGLGLSIARQILRDLGGDLIFEPVPGNGSCFTARIKNHDKD